MSKKKSHIHKYQRVLWGKKETPVLRCMLINCTHYVHPEMAVNRRSICWKCGEPFTLNIMTIKKKRPKCNRCSTKEDPALMKLDDLLAGLE